MHCAVKCYQLNFFQLQGPWFSNYDQTLLIIYHKKGRKLMRWHIMKKVLH